MNIAQQLPEEIATYLKDTQLQKFSVSDKIIIPMHKVKMRLKHPVTHKYVYQNVTIPDITIAINNRGNGQHYYRDDLSYHLTMNNKAFPYGHIYDSGYLCLGSIFVPNKIHKASIMQPIETLFLYNDANTNHGGAYVRNTEHRKNCLLDLLRKYQDKTLTAKINKADNLLIDDLLWWVVVLIQDNEYNPLTLNKQLNQFYKIMFD